MKSNFPVLDHQSLLFLTGFISAFMLCPTWIAAQTAEEEMKKEIERMLEQIPGFDIEDGFEEFKKKHGEMARNVANQNIRNRRIGVFEKQNEKSLEPYLPVVNRGKQSTVQISYQDKLVCFGTVIDDRGGIITKAGELISDQRDQATHFQCTFANGKEYDATIQKIDEKSDLALLFIKDVKTIPIKWARESAELGTFVVVGDHLGQPKSIGVVSVLPRSVVGSDLAFLGVGPGPHREGVEVLLVEEETAAERAGLKPGDVITSLADERIDSVTKLVNTIRGFSPGTKVTINYRRDGKRLQTDAILDSANLPGDREQGMQLMKRMGAILSDRHAEFPSVLQHDSPIFPEQCGGPLLNLDGDAIGINIARAGRTESFAIPAVKVDEIVRRLKADTN